MQAYAVISGQQFAGAINIGALWITVPVEHGQLFASLGEHVALQQGKPVRPQFFEMTGTGNCAAFSSISFLEAAEVLELYFHVQFDNNPLWLSLREITSKLLQTSQLWAAIRTTDYKSRRENVEFEGQLSTCTR